MKCFFYAALVRRTCYRELHLEQFWDFQFFSKCGAKMGAL